MPRKLKKSLGQHFLINKSIVRRIADAAELSNEDIVLEIGPGKGVLTEELIRRAGAVIAIEIDKNLAAFLANKFKNYSNFHLIKGDVLKLNLPEFYTKYQIPDTRYKLVANIPYYITQPIIKLFLESPQPPSEMILMVQKEVAERIIASPGKMSLLSAAAQYYAHVSLLFPVLRDSFYPSPEVDSAVIKIVPYRVHDLKMDKNFFRVVRAGFCAKRKTLVNNLANSFHLDKNVIEGKLKKAGITSTARAQELSIEDWERLVPFFKDS